MIAGLVQGWSVPDETVTADITVVGGGLAGVCAAIAAARAGRSVSLVQNRSVLGGNSSSEIRVWVCGATAHGQQSLARETGILGELLLENQYANPDGNPYYWDLILAEAVKAEPRIQLFLDTDVREVSATGPASDRTITAVSGWMMGSERKITFRSVAFIDCSGDGLVGALAGAQFRLGCEARSEYGESWAPVSPTAETLGSTLLFYTKDVGHHVPYIAPSDALDISQTDIPEFRRLSIDANGCDYWWIEWGGDHDVVADNEKIRAELQRAVYGIWDWIKNSGNFAAENLTLEWVGSVPGKREYRRFVGDVTLTQHDVIGLRSWPDAIGYGGWSIDLHPPGGLYAREAGSRHWYPDGPYEIPLRSLFSKNVRNLWFAGRSMSASHVAFGSTRVMGTCAVTGEGAGLAAALSQSIGVSPRELATQQSDALRHSLMRGDSSIIGVRDDDPLNLALSGRAVASSTLECIAVADPSGTLLLDRDIGVVIPVTDELRSVDLLVRGAGEIRLEVWETRTGQVYLPFRLVKTVVGTAGDTEQWVNFPLGYEADTPRNLFLVLHARDGQVLCTSAHTLPGVLMFTRRPETQRVEGDGENNRPWKPYDVNVSPCMRVPEKTRTYAPSQVIGGYSRPFAGPNMWVSGPACDDPEPWIEVRWDLPVQIRAVDIIMDASIEIDLINLHHHYTPQRVMPGLVTAYEIALEIDGKWFVVEQITDNHKRLRHHDFGRAHSAVAVRVTARQFTAEQARIVNIRAW